MLLPFLLWQELGFLDQDDNSAAGNFAYSFSDYENVFVLNKFDLKIGYMIYLGCVWAGSQGTPELSTFSKSQETPELQQLSSRTRQI